MQLEVLKAGLVGSSLKLEGHSLRFLAPLIGMSRDVEGAKERIGLLGGRPGESEERGR